MSRNIPNNSMPEDFFCRHNLELSFRLLRNKHPLLAHALKNAIDDSKAVNYDELHANYTSEMLLNNDLVILLQPHTIGKIVSALTDMGRQALQRNDLPPQHMAILRTLIEDWVELTEWILLHTSEDTTDKTSYH
jgi:hypothetical protein